MEIKWKQGAGYKVAAATAYKAIEDIRAKQGGRVTAEDVVAVAARKRHVLHGEFEWDDAEAATQHRLEQARSMMRSLHVIRRTSDATEATTRVYEVVRHETRPSTGRPQYAYATTEELLRDPETRSELLNRALQELLAFQKKFRHLQELAIVMRTIDEVVATTVVK